MRTVLYTEHVEYFDPLWYVLYVVYALKRDDVWATAPRSGIIPRLNLCRSCLWNLCYWEWYAITYPLMLLCVVDVEKYFKKSKKKNICRFCGSNTVPPDGPKSTSVWRSPKWAKATWYLNICGLILLIYPKKKALQYEDFLSFSSNHDKSTSLDNFLQTMSQPNLSGDDRLHRLLEQEYAAFVVKENMVIKNGAQSLSKWHCRASSRLEIVLHNRTRGHPSDSQSQIPSQDVQNSYSENTEFGLAVLDLHNAFSRRILEVLPLPLLIVGGSCSRWGIQPFLQKKVKGYQFLLALRSRTTRFSLTWSLI